jgi:hypothetical protein
MGRFTAGVAAGVIVSFLAIMLFDGISDDEESTQFAATSSGAIGLDLDTDTAAEPPSERNSTGIPEENAETTTAPAVQPRLAESETSDRARLRIETERAIAEALRASEQLKELDRADVLAEPVVSPISLPSEFDWLSRQLRFEHEAIQRERRDEPWASSTEAQLLSFFYDSQQVVETYGTPTVNCHSTRCEVSFIRYGVKEKPPTAYRSLISPLTVTPSQSREELAAPVRSSIWHENFQGDTATIFWILER